MSDENEAEKGHLEGRTQAVPEFPGADEIGDAMLALRPPEGKQLDLLAEKAEVQNAARRGMGRPFGALNRRNDATFDALEKLGYKNPVVRLMEIVSADPYRMGVAPDEGIKLQIRAAEALLPYMLAKKPQTLQIDKNTLHVFMAGPLQQPGIGTEQNQWVTVDGTVRENAEVSHGSDIPSKINELPPENR